MRRKLAIATIASVLTFGIPEKSSARFLDPMDVESAAAEADDRPGLWDVVGIIGVCALLRRHLEHHDRESTVGRRTSRHA
jgi:hypothetical protein